MKIRCAWHNRIIGEKEPLEDDSVTDGICDDCLARYFPSVAGKIAKLEITEQERYPDYKVRSRRQSED